MVYISNKNNVLKLFLNKLHVFCAFFQILMNVQQTPIVVTTEPHV